MTVKQIAKILWSPVRRVDGLLRADRGVAEPLPGVKPGEKDRGPTERPIGPSDGR